MSVDVSTSRNELKLSVAEVAPVSLMSGEVIVPATRSLEENELRESLPKYIEKPAESA